LYPVILAFFYVVNLPMLGSVAAMAGVSAAYFLLHAWAARAAYAVTAADPADPALQANPDYRKIVGGGLPPAAAARGLPPPLHESCFGSNDGSNPAAAPEQHGPPTFCGVLGSVAACGASTCVHGACGAGVGRQGSSDATDFCYHCQVRRHIFFSPPPPAPPPARPLCGFRQYARADPRAQSAPARPSLLSPFSLPLASRARPVLPTCGAPLAQVHVSKTAKHCRFCDKCVHRFDHHCAWLNNCVGTANYRDFLAVLVSTLAFTAMQLALAVLLLVRVFGGGGGGADLRARAVEVYGSSTAYTVLLLVECALLAPVVVLIAQLLHFHTVLLRRRQTTYEFVTGVKAAPARRAAPPKGKPAPAPASSKPVPKRKAEPSAEATAAAANISAAAASAEKTGDEGDIELGTTTGKLEGTM